MTTLTAKQIREKATKWMETTANDPKHGYDQIKRWGEKGDYDCSAAVITAWTNAGVDLKGSGATYTGNLEQALKKNHFTDVTADVDRKTGKGLERGDVLFAKGHHVAMYCGNGKEVEASINEKGKATGGKPGDQTGKEFLIRSYRNYPWTNIYRYEKKASSTSTTVKSATKKAVVKKKQYIVTAPSGLNIREKPKGRIITAAPYGATLTYVSTAEKHTGWTAIKYGVSEGYVASEYIKEKSK